MNNDNNSQKKDSSGQDKPWTQSKATASKRGGWAVKPPFSPKSPPQASRMQGKSQRPAFGKASIKSQDSVPLPSQGKPGQISAGPRWNRFNEQRSGRPIQGRPAGRFGRPAGVERAEEWKDSPASKRFGPSSHPVYRPGMKPAPMPFKPHQRPLPTIAPSEPQREAELTVHVEEDIAPVNILTGRNPIREAIKAGHDLEKLMIAKGELSGSAREIVNLAKKAGVMVQAVERTRLDQIARNHQGMIAYASAYQYSTVEDILSQAEKMGEDPFIIILDQITDPHNLGAIIRTASCAGAHGVIVPMHRAVGLTPAAVKASAGAVEHIKVARVTNLNQTIKSLQEKGIWIYGADPAGEDYRTVVFSGPCAMVIGSEGEGVSKLTSSLCDKQVRIPMRGEISSLNASVAAGILMYAIFNTRNLPKQ